jgi:hypothetical protein
MAAYVRILATRTTDSLASFVGRGQTCRIAQEVNH